VEIGDGPGQDKVVLLCDARLRAPLAQMLARSLPMLPVVAYDEIVLGTDVQSIATGFGRPR
jgi:flagellar biosynthesis component FlhA